MKSLSALAIAELGIAEMMAGKAYAFVGVMSGDVYGLGLAVANEQGYNPIPLHWANFPDFNSAMADAERLNRDLLEMDATAAARIVCSTMRKG